MREWKQHMGKWFFWPEDDRTYGPHDSQDVAIIAAKRWRQERPEYADHPFYVGQMCPAVAMVPTGWLGSAIAEMVDEYLGQEIASEDAIIDLSPSECDKLGEEVLRVMAAMDAFDSPGWEHTARIVFEEYSHEIKNT